MSRLAFLLFAAVSFIIGFVQAGTAADLPVKAPIAKAPTAAYDWTGFYLGANVGYGVGRNGTEQSLLIPPIGLEGSTNISPAGFLGGIQGGYNWQSGHVVLGVEGDWQWTGEKDLSCLDGEGFCGGSYLSLDQRLKWIATARARIGYADDRWLWYITGGGAWGQIDNDFSVVGAGPLAEASASHNNSGWTVGGGVETAFSGTNWTTKFEYLYVDLGSTADSFTSGAATANSNIRNHIVRIGLNYRIGGHASAQAAIAGAPSPDKTPPAPALGAYDWTGLYVGANVGYGVGRNGTDQSLLIPPPVFSPMGSFNTSPAGVLGGIQAGYNWQVGHLVLGVEGDWQWTGQKDSTCSLDCAFSALSLDQRLKWFGTVRARIGYADDVRLWYVTGGGAWGRIDNDFSDEHTVPPPEGVSASHDNSGWVVGGGVETALWRSNWTAKLEYLYMELGSTTDSFDDVLGFTAITTSDIRDHVVRVGLNYRFRGG